ncbi:DMT family transporter [Flexibacterium corallicola]|uniref:DMT family transporter n=1 Tax=Flexibacterium corallicola TaxID=3037259 RepID=UPI00286EE961|nr:EamA family transporter [Pseudovibrio sp. M1P-2-3]
MKASSQTAVSLTLLATFFWGSNFQATKIAIASIPPWTASVERFSIAVIAIMVVMMVKGAFRREILIKNLLPFAILGVIGVAGFNGSLFLGLQTSNPITAALIMATTPISANIVEALISKKLPEIIRVIGMVISLIGVALVVTNGEILSGNIFFATGDIMIFLGSIAWAVYTVGTRVFVSDSTPLETTTWTMLFGTVGLSIMAFSLEFPIIDLQSGNAISHISCLYMGIAGSVLAYLFWNVGVATRGPGKTSIFFNFVPVFALGVSAIFGKMPSIIQLLGVLVTTCGVLVAQGQVSAWIAEFRRLRQVS